MSGRKRKKTSCPFASSKKLKKRKSTSKEFCVEHARSLALSNRGSYYSQDEWLLEDASPANKAVEQPVTSASRTKLLLEDGRGSETATTTKSSEDVEPWEKLCGRTIVSGDRLQENLVKAVTCRFCHSNIQLLENITGRRGLGATWEVRCENHECPSHALTSSFSTTERGLCFDVNRALVLGMRTIGRGQSAAVRALSFLGLRPINKAYWTENTKRIEKEAKLILEEELNAAAFEVKEKKFALGEVVSSHEELHEKVIDAGITIDASWSTRGWSSSDGVVAAISVDTGKVLDVVHLSSTCAECTKMEAKKKGGSMSRLDWHRWFERHEPNCFLNHVSLGVLHFNQGFQRTYTKLVPALDIDLKPEMSDTWEKIDADRVYQSDYRAASSTKTKRKKKRKQKLKKQDVFIHQEGVMYKSQGFHEVNKDKGKISKKGKKGNGQGKSNGNARQKQNAKNKGKGKQKK